MFIYSRWTGFVLPATVWWLSVVTLTAASGPVFSYFTSYIDDVDLKSPIVWIFQPKTDFFVCFLLANEQIVDISWNIYKTTVFCMCSFCLVCNSCTETEYRWTSKLRTEKSSHWAELLTCFLWDYHTTRCQNGSLCNTKMYMYNNSDYF